MKIIEINPRLKPKKFAARWENVVGALDAFKIFSNRNYQARQYNADRFTLQFLFG